MTNAQSPGVSVVFVCHDRDGRILLARRSSGARDEPGTWDCGAGALERGETFEQAVTREVTEEYGTAPVTITQRGVRNVLRPGSHWVAVIFSVEIDPAAARIGEPHKFDALDWFTPDTLPSPLHTQLRPTLDVALAPAVQTMWIFHGEAGRYASGLFATAGEGLAWTAANMVTGLLTEYAVGGTYDVARQEGRFTPSRPHHGTPAHVVTFSPGLEHLHIVDGRPA